MNTPSPPLKKHTHRNAPHAPRRSLLIPPVSFFPLKRGRNRNRQKTKDLARKSGGRRVCLGATPRTMMGDDSLLSATALSAYPAINSSCVVTCTGCINTNCLCCCTTTVLCSFAVVLYGPLLVLVLYGTADAGGEGRAELCEP